MHGFYDIVIALNITSAAGSIEGKAAVDLTAVQPERNINSLNILKIAVCSKGLRKENFASVKVFKGFLGGSGIIDHIHSCLRYRSDPQRVS